MERLVLWHRWVVARREAEPLPESLASWPRAVAARWLAAGGDLLGGAGASLAVAFETTETTDVIELCLDLLDEADAAELAITIGAAVGELVGEGEFALGAAIERAQLLANRAREGELVLDASARALAADSFLFGRQVSAGAGAARGITVDRSHPRRVDCAEAIAELRAPPLPPILEEVSASLEARLRDGSVDFLILRGPVGAGASEVVNRLELALSPGPVIRVGAAPGGLVPLGSLRLAIGRALGDADAIRAALADLPEVRDVFLEVSEGRLVPRERLADALARWFGHLAREAAPWLLLSPLTLVDGATLDALLAARDRGAELLFIGRYPLESALPRPLAVRERVFEVTLPALKISDASTIAEGLLGEETETEVARRVAVLGGDTVLGVVEAARTLIATGELVRRGGGFAWRGSVPSGARSIGTDELIRARVEALEVDARRILEIVCVAPDGWPRERLAEVASLDDVELGRFDSALALLTRESLLVGGTRPRPASSLLRWQVLGSIPPARSMELHRFAAEIVGADPTDVPGLVELAHYLIEGGREGDAPPLLARARESLREAGYERSARQLGAKLERLERSLRPEATAGPRPTPPPPRAEFDEEPPSSVELTLDPEPVNAPPPARLPERDPVIEAAAAQAPPRESEPPSTIEMALEAAADSHSVAPPRETSPPTIADDAVAALKDRDFPRLEEAMRRAVAEGGDLGAVGRVQALGELARGELALARESLARAEHAGRDEPGARARHLLTSALLELSAGEIVLGLRASLGALACSRRADDSTGEVAALLTLARCYRSLDRAEDAEQLDAKAEAVKARIGPRA